MTIQNPSFDRHRKPSHLQRFLSIAPSSADRYFLGVFTFLAVIKLAVILFSPLDLAADEAHYWMWSKKLDYNYYSKGPVVSLLIAASTEILGDTPFAVRLPAFLCWGVFSIVLYYLLRLLLPAGVSFLTFVGLQSMLYFSVLGVVITTDPPLLMFWLIALFFSVLAIKRNAPRWWVIVGVCSGFAFLSKYTAILFYPGVFLFLVFHPSFRSHLKSVGFLFGGMLFLSSVALVLWWNAQHGWVSFRHNASHLLNEKSNIFNVRYAFELISGQLGLIGPIFFVGIFCAYGVARRYIKAGDGISGLMFFTGVPLGIICFLVSCTKRVYANWPMPLYVGGVILVAYCFEKGIFSKERVMKWALPGFFINFVISFGAFFPIFGVPLGLPMHILPTKKLVGWNDLAFETDKRLVVAQGKSSEKMFLVADYYGISSLLSFYMSTHPFVYCARLADRRMNQYDLWGGWEENIGKDALLIFQNEEVPPEIYREFVEIKPFGEPYQVKYAGEVIKSFYFFIGRRFKPSPQDVSIKY